MDQTGRHAHPFMCNDLSEKRKFHILIKEFSQVCLTFSLVSWFMMVMIMIHNCSSTEDLAATE